MEHVENFKSVKAKLQSLLDSVKVEEKFAAGLSAGDKEIYEQGMQDGITQYEELTSGASFDAESAQAIYDRGATVGQLLGRLKDGANVEDFEADPTNGSLVFAG